MRRRRNLEIFLLLLLATETTAQTPQIVSILAKPVEQNLAVNVQFADLFSPKIVSTIRSGLPAVIRFDFRLVEEPDREIQQMTRFWRIVYDLWSDRYGLQFKEHEQFAASFAELEKICANFEEAKLLPLSHLSPQRAYRLRLRIAVIPISAKQDQQLRDWLEASEATEESAPGEDRSSGFRLNLSKLLSFFWEKKEQPFSMSAWVVSPPFRVDHP